MPWLSFDPFGDMIEKQVNNARQGLPADARTQWPGQDAGEPKENTDDEPELTADDYIKAYG